MSSSSFRATFCDINSAFCDNSSTFCDNSAAFCATSCVTVLACSMTAAFAASNSDGVRESAARSVVNLSSSSGSEKWPDTACVPLCFAIVRAHHLRNEPRDPPARELPDAAVEWLSIYEYLSARGGPAVLRDHSRQLVHSTTEV